MMRACDRCWGLCRLVVPDNLHGDPSFFMSAYMAAVQRHPANASVIIPAVSENLLHDLPRLLQSIDNQQLLPTSVVVVVSGIGEDACARLRETTACHLFDVHVKCLQATVNQATARNIGIALAECEWLLFIDADNVMTPRYVARVEEHIRGNLALRLILHGFSRPRAKQLPPAPAPILRGVALYDIAQKTQ